MITPLFCSFIRRKDMDSVLNCLVTDSVGPGEYTEKFIKAARDVFGYEYAIALRSPYSALMLALRSLGLEPGSAIAVSAVAPAYHRLAVQEAGFLPVYADYDVEQCVIDFESFAAMEPKPRALLLFDAFGILPDPSALKALGLSVIEDMSQALGAEREGTKAGALGNLCIYGLEQGSLVTAGGGALLAAQGKRDAPVLKNLAETLPPELLMTDYNAALGIAQLKDLSSTIEIRRSQEAKFQLELARTRHGTFRQIGEGTTGTFAFPVSIESGMRDARVYAKKNGIETEPAFDGSVVAMTDFPENICPGARALALRCLDFPVHQRIGGPQAQIIARVLATLP